MSQHHGSPAHFRIRYRWSLATWGDRYFLSPLAIALIRCYQRWISPYKGFRCAHGVYFGGASCSAWAINMTHRLGALRMVLLLPRRFRQCRHAHQLLLASAEETPPQVSKELEGKKKRSTSAWCGSLVDGCCTGFNCTPAVGDAGAGGCDAGAVGCEGGAESCAGGGDCGVGGCG